MQTFDRLENEELRLLETAIKMVELSISQRLANAKYHDPANFVDALDDLADWCHSVIICGEEWEAVVALPTNLIKK